MLDRDREVRPIQYPQRPNIAIRGTPRVRKANLAPSKYVDERRSGITHVIFDYQAETNPLRDKEKYEVISPDDPHIEVDSANDVSQVYYLPPANVRGHQGLRPIVDTINNIHVAYYYDRMTNQWIKMVTRLQKDLTYPEPPVGYNYNYLQYYGSRGTRYVRTRKRLSRNVKDHRSKANRIYYGNRAGTSGARYDTGVFRNAAR